MHGSPRVRILSERISAVLEEHTKGFEFAGSGGVVERTITVLVYGSEDLRTEIEQCRNEMEGSCAGFAGKHQGIEAFFVLVWNTFWEALCEHCPEFFFAGYGGEHEGGFPVIVAADEVGFVAGFYEEFGDLGEAIFGSKMQRCIALIIEIGIAKRIWVVAYNAFDKREVV